jgi:multidrug resistance efflux pump
MSSAAPDYQALYEQAVLEAEKAFLEKQVALAQAEQKQQEAEALIAELSEKLTLNLFELDRLRRKLFGRSSDNRFKYTE